LKSTFIGQLEMAAFSQSRLYASTIYSGEQSF